jgi:hypothetical protein
MPITPKEDYGIKVAKFSRSALSKERIDLGFSSAVATYMLARIITAKVNSNPYVIIHNLGYIPKVIIFEILSDHNRKLPYYDGIKSRDFSITSTEIKIRGVTTGTFKIFIFGQSVL